MSARMWLAGRPGSLVLVAEGWPGLRLVANLLLGGASGGCGFAAVGGALYAGSPAQVSAAVLFAGFGFVAGLMCGGLHAVFEGLPTPPAATMPPEVLASLVRATLASAGAAERAPRSGSAADRRPSPAQWARAALADAAATSMGVPASASTAVGTAANTAASTVASTVASTAENTAANTVDAMPTIARSSPPVAAVVPAAPPQPVDRRRFARSEFGA